MERLLGQTLGNKVEFSVKTAEQVGMTDEIEENGSTFEENARIKARALASDRYISIADDSGLSVDALGGAPGVYSARWSGEGDAGNNQKLLSELEGKRGEGAQSALCYRRLLYSAGRQGADAARRVRGTDTRRTARRGRLRI